MTLHRGAVWRDGAVSLRPPLPSAIRAVPKDDDVVGPAQRWLAEAEADERSYYFAIHERERLVGQIVLHDIDRRSGEALVAYHLFERRDRGRGIGTRALGLVQRFVRAEAALRRLFVITSADNAASRRIAEKCGFAHVGPPREDPSGVCLRWDAL